MAKIVCTAEHVSKSFGNMKALEDVSIEMLEGEVFGLLGSNGAGKSTLTKIMTGLLSADSGSVNFFGSGLSANYNSLKKIFSVVPQEVSCYYGFTVRENIDFFCKMYGLRGKELEQRTQFLIEWLSLEKYRDVPANNLSGGFKRLLNIACSLVNDPQIIFMDEPTVGLDPKMRQLLWGKIKELKEQGRTICLTTHYLDEAQALCNRVGLLVNGRLLVKGMPQELIERYGGYRILIIKVDKEISTEHAQQIKGSFEGAQVEIFGGTIVVSFLQKHSLEKISLLTQWLGGEGYEILSSIVKEPELEDVFLNLTGEKLRD
ncbi:MAG TPA: ABC transporter ATP-binding protein [archaeon]|nr:ABC transporter ATP-binding protein [archaeon]